MKDLTRKKMKIIRDGLSSDARKMAESAINLTLTEFVLSNEFKVIAGYYPIKSEVSVLKALEECASLDICLPRIEHGEIVFRRWKAGDPIELNKYCYEPLESNTQLIPDLIIMPCLAYDLEGNRLGYGAGYYDKVLKKYPKATTTVVAFSSQEIENLPIDEWDEKVDYIINDVAIKKISQ